MKNKSPERWHGAHQYSNKVHLFLIFFLFFSIFTLVFFYTESHSDKFNYRISNSTQTPNTSCTEEAKICPDGTTVVRSGPNCEFPDCL